ncbi:DUF6754 domain-containing protein [Acidobacteriota bacterium]
MRRPEHKKHLTQSAAIVSALILAFLAVTFLTSPAIAQIEPATAEEEPGIVDQEPAASQEKPAPPASFEAKDKPTDSGSRISLSWAKSPDDGQGNESVVGYNIYRADSEQGPWSKLNKDSIIPKGDGAFEDSQEYLKGGHEVKNGKVYHYRVKSVTKDAVESEPRQASASAGRTFYNVTETNTFIAVGSYMAILLIMIFSARLGKTMYIRRLAGIDAIEEAVGRATEMGKPVLYTTGMHEMSDVSTIAAINILSGVAKKVGEYQSRLILPCRDPMVMTVAQEVVKEAYLSIGRPDAYREEDIFYTTYDQFPWVASVDGIMLREKPATNLYMGYYYAESLILAETGASTGAIQIAGTDSVTQLPFFVTACDYTLLGEELYAASAYISNDPQLVGSLKGQDYMKFILAVTLLFGIAAATLYSINPEWTLLPKLINAFKP